MILYAAIWEDRHSDTTVHLFSNADKAIEWARTQCKECDRWGVYEEREIKGWLFCADYSCEGDGIRVVEVEVDAELKES